MGNDASNVANEAHIEHSVRLIENEEVHVLEADNITAVENLEQTAGGRNDEVDATSEAVDLRPNVYTAIDDVVTYWQVLCVVLDAFADLAREFTRRRQNQSAGYTATTLRNKREKTLQHRKNERGGFAGARLCTSKHVTLFEEKRDCLRLDRRRLRVAAFTDRAKDGLIKSKGVEIRQESSQENVQKDSRVCERARANHPKLIAGKAPVYRRSERRAPRPQERKSSLTSYNAVERISTHFFCAALREVQ